MKANTLDARGEQMLELLAQGASARVIAKKLGYSEGTTRVYLHNLYRTIGVRNKTDAVIWHLGRTRAPVEARPAPAVVPVGVTRDFFGEMALAEDLYTALGVMSSFLGPYGHVWEAAMRLKGTPVDETIIGQRAQSRLLWRALLKGDFGYGKTLYDSGSAERLLLEAPADGLQLAMLLLIGGYSHAAGKVAAQLERKRKSRTPITVREASLLHSVRDAMYADDAGALTTLHGLATENGGPAGLRQLALVALYQVSRCKRDLDAVRAAAAAVWAEAEAARQQLEAMGVRPLGREGALSRPGKGASSKEAAPSREKVLVTR